MQKRGYSYLKQKPDLICFAWLHRIFIIIIKKRDVDIADSDVSEAVQNRINLFGDLKMI